MARLGDVCIINPKTPVIDDNLTVSFIPMPKVGENGEFDASEIKEYREVKKGFTYFQNGDVLFAKITPCMENGKGAVARMLENGIGFGSTEFHVLRPKDGNVLSKWIYYLLSWSNFRKEAENNMTGSAGQKRVPKSFLENYNVMLPPPEKQKNQIDSLAKIDDVITLRKQQLSKLDELVKSRFIEMFGDRGQNPFNYPTTTMGDVYKFQYGKGNNIPEDKGEYLCYGSNGVVGHHTEYNSEDSPIIGHIGAYAGIVNWGKGKHYVTYNGVICKLIHDKVNPVYGFYLLQLQDYNTVAKAGAAQPFVSYKDLEVPVVNIPSLERQNQFAAFVEQTDKSKFKIQKSLEKLETLKKALMQKYFG